MCFCVVQYLDILIGTINHKKTNILIWKQTFIHIYKKKNKVSAHERRSVEDNFIPSAKKSFWKITRDEYWHWDVNTAKQSETQEAVVMNEEQLCINTKCLKWAAIKLSRRSSASYSCGVWIWRKYTHTSHTHTQEGDHTSFMIWCMWEQRQNRRSYTGSVVKMKSKLAFSHKQNGAFEPENKRNIWQNVSTFFVFSLA